MSASAAVAPSARARAFTCPMVLGVLAALAWLLAGTAPGAAQTAAEAELARTYAPVVRLERQEQECGPGEAYEPTDVDGILDSPDVALRGPWDATNVVKVAPGAGDLAPGLDGYHLDYPGDALRPGCVYEQWGRRIAAEHPSTAYARVASEAGIPGKLALQYWFFYVFNDWNNTHEADWEMIQLVFDADTPEQALERGPAEVGYSQHSSAERADWGDKKVELVDGTRPVVYPGTGSHANYFGPEVFLMRSTAEGVGCDNASGPHRELRPRVRVIPSDPAAAVAAYPWLGYRGKWGERQSKLYEAPTGPATKTQWAQPITWSRTSWRDESFTVPSAGAVGGSATDFFCFAVGGGSKLLRQVQTHPVPATIAFGALALLLVWGLGRTTWRPSTPLPLAGARPWGAILTASWRMYRLRPGAFLTVGLLFIPIGIVSTVVQLLIFRVAGLRPLVDEAGEQNPFVGGLALGLGLVVTLLGYGVVQAATARLMLDIEGPHRARASAAYRSVMPGLGRLLAALAVAVTLGILLNLTLVLIPVALFFIVRWSLLSIVLVVENRPEPGVLRRSAELVSGHWWRTATLVVLVGGAGLLAGPAFGAVALFATGLAFDMVNLISAVVYVAVLPLVAIATTYLYFDLLARREGAHSEPEAGEPALTAPAGPA